MFEHSYEHLFSFTATLDAPQFLGPVPEGLRIVFPITGGEVTGPRVKGHLLLGGGDWMTGRRDGVAILDVRGTIETDDGALIYVFYTGVTDLGPDGYDKALAGQMPASLDIRTTPRFLTSHPDYEWMNRIQCVGIGRSETADLKVAYDVYAMR